MTNGGMVEFADVGEIVRVLLYRKGDLISGFQEEGYKPFRTEGVIMRRIDEEILVRAYVRGSGFIGWFSKRSEYVKTTVSSIEEVLD